MKTPTLRNFVQPITPFLHHDEPDLFGPSWLARYALRCREKPDLLDEIIAELESVVFGLRTDEEINKVWLDCGLGYTASNGSIRQFLTLALGAFETAKLSAEIPMKSQQE
jgi:hypothetical protein